MSLSRFAVGAPVKVTMIFVAVLLLGMISLRRLPTNLFPDIRTPKVTTTIKTRGLSPLEVERRINEPLERQLYTLRGVADVETIARADSAVIITEFTWDTPLDFAFLDVKKAVGDLQRERSQEVESVAVLRYDPNAAPILTVGLACPPDVPIEDLRRLAEQTLKPRFERLEGVANVVVSGGSDREIRVAVDEARMQYYGVELDTVVSALKGENINATGGFITEGTRRFLLKAMGEFKDLEDIRQVVVTRKNDSPVLVRDVAEVSFAAKEPKDAVRLNGAPAIGMEFYREAEGNTVAVARLIRDEIEAIQGSAGDKPAAKFGPPAAKKEGLGILPAGARIVVAEDQSEFISAAILDVRDNAVMGGVLAVAILLLFLRDTRTTLIIAISIPVSIVATFNLMFFQGLSLNLMTLGGLALGSGMLVDNAIVVLENIFRLRQLGRDPFEAAREGTRQVGAAIIASTLTTVVVFLPIVYVRGVAGLLFKEQSLTVAYSLLASLLVALLLIPMLASRFAGKPPASMMMIADDADRTIPDTFYVRTLRWTLRFRGLVIVAALVLFGISALLAVRIPREFLPHTEQRHVGLRLSLPSGTTIDSTTRITETILGRAQQYGKAVETTYARVGESTGKVQADTEDPDGPNTADVHFQLHDWDHPTSETIQAGLGDFRSSDLVAGLKPTIDLMPGVKAEFKLQQGSILELLGTSGAPLLIEITGEEVPELSRLAEAVRARLAQTPGLLNVRTNILEGSPEIHINLDEGQLARLGLDVQGVANVLRRRIDGEVAGQVKRDSGDLDLVVEVDYGTETLDTLRDIVIAAPGGAQIPLRTIATFDIIRGPREIVRRHQERVARVMADLGDVKLSEAIVRAQGSLADLELPRGYHLEFSGEEAERADAFRKLGFALLLSLFLVYMVMASIFESFIQPFLIMFTIPLAGIGVVLGFLLMDQTLNVMGLIGVVMLGGIVVNNAIVLLDCVNQVRAQWNARDRASMAGSLIAGCERRLRPVMMTTLTTLLGLLPLALGIGQGAELRQAMAVAVLGGLLSSTVLTLYVIPACQSYLDSATIRVHAWRHRRGLVEDEPAPAPKAEDAEA